MIKLKKGDRFLHSKWLSIRYSLEQIKKLPKETTALLCQVTAFRDGNCHYKPVYSHGDREVLGTGMCHPIERMDEVIMKPIYKEGKK